MIRRCCCFALLTVLVLVTTIAAMPPHPELAARIRSGAVPEPFALAHRAELLARGVDHTPAATIERLRQRALDENLNIIAILVDFSDNPSHIEADYFDGLLFGDNVGSLRHYYSEISYGTLTLVSVNLPSELDWQRMPHTYDYYVDGQNGFGNYPQNAQGLAEAAVLAVDPVVDFSNYDVNGDGYVDGLFIIHSGPGAERTGSNDQIWSHKWSMPETYVDGVTADVYSMEPEYWDQAGDMTCGVYAHEMGHSVFFLPDLYDYDYDSEGLGRWSLMAGGSWNGGLGSRPAHPDAQSRVQMGFVQPVRITQSLLNQPIPPVENQAVIYELWTGGQDNHEHFLVENRRLLGYDASLPGEGLLIYHVDENVWRNDDQWFPEYTEYGHYRVALEQADGFWSLEHNSSAGDAGDPYPGATDNRSFKATSTPNSNDYAGFDTDVAVRHINFTGDTALASLYINASSYIFVVAPTITGAAGTPVCFPITVETDLDGRNITGFAFTLSYDADLLSLAPPYFDISGGLVPPSWSVTESHTVPGQIQVSASGSLPLSGMGTLLCVPFNVLEAAPDQTGGSVNFAAFTLSGGLIADTTNGSIVAQAPRVILYPQPINFGYIEPGQQGTRAFIVRNMGHADLRLDSARVGLPFSTDFTVSRTVAPNTWTPFMVYFNPGVGEYYSDTVRIYGNNPGGVLQVVLYGRGTLAADEPPSAQPDEFYLDQNYPNPFNPVTEIRFGLPRTARVSVKVYDLLGREVASLAAGTLAAGHHSVTWDAGRLSTGLYLVVMEGEGLHLVRKAMLVR